MKKQKPPLSVRLSPDQEVILREMAREQHTTMTQVIKTALFGSKNAEKSAA